MGEGFAEVLCCKVGLKTVLQTVNKRVKRVEGLTQGFSLTEIGYHYVRTFASAVVVLGCNVVDGFFKFSIPSPCVADKGMTVIFSLKLSTLFEIIRPNPSI